MARTQQSRETATGDDATPCGRVVVADALPSAREYAAGLLRAQGYVVTECEAAGEISSTARRHEADAVFVDVGFPGLDPDVLIRQLDLALAPQRVAVVLTCPRDIDEARLARFEAGGALLVLVKPLSPAGLLGAARQAVADSLSRQVAIRPRPRHAA